MPLARLELKLIAGAETLIVKLRLPVYGAWKPAEEESVAVTVKLKVPVAVGVPDKTPAPLSDNPAGGAPAVTAKAYGAVPPVAVKFWL